LIAGMIDSPAEFYAACLRREIGGDAGLRSFKDRSVESF